MSESTIRFPEEPILPLNSLLFNLSSVQLLLCWDTTDACKGTALLCLSWSDKIALMVYWVIISWGLPITKPLFWNSSHFKRNNSNRKVSVAVLSFLKSTQQISVPASNKQRDIIITKSLHRVAKGNKRSFEIWNMTKLLFSVKTPHMTEWSVQ